ncbi:acyl-CoA dehydrogenase family protein [Pseudonocardia xishanensis]|uniref:Acyl-CoA dehydrogenase n=1 Tax=Pseudonocardia xishanensis TaxID=630995 RepID=A0ABP8RQH8_9PSEU
MDFRLSELQRELASATRDLLDARCPASVVRASREKPDGVADLWSALAELGLPGALVPEDAGGLGLSTTDLLPALQETGRAAVPAPIVETALVAVPLLAAAGNAELVAAVAAGDAVVTVAPAGEPVPWAAAATHVVLLGEHVSLLTRAELRGEPVPAVDGSRPLTVLGGEAGHGETHGEALGTEPALGRSARARAAVGLAAQLVGLAERQLSITVEYVADRRQFGVPVGSFQAVKHHLADALLAVRFARPAVLAAGLALDADPVAADAATARAVALAKATASDAADLVSTTAVQCHGAMGYTDEYDLQLYAKRGWALAAAWGTATEHRAAYGDALGLPRSH